MENFSLLGPGLGFYEKKPEPTSEKNLVLPDLPNLDLSEDFDLDSAGAYEHLLSVLEKPYLGERADPALGGSRAFSSSVSPLVSVPKVLPAPPEKVSPLAPPEKVLPAPPVYFCFSPKAYLMDAFVVSLLFFPPLLFFAFLTEPFPLQALKVLWLQVLVVFFLFAQVYCFLCRLFCFETFGESFAKIRLFTRHSQSKSPPHPFRLFWRFLLSILTGIILMPVFSLVFGKDIMARLTGLYFQKNIKE